MREAGAEDVGRLVELMAEFYAESGYQVNSGHAAEAFATLIADERLGKVWLIEAEGREVGYIVVTLGYSMEYGGGDAFVDDLFIGAPFRNQGLGTQALAEARAFCAARGVRALHLEVGRDNEPAQVLYRRAGFEDTERQLLTLKLARPTHADG